MKICIDCKIPKEESEFHKHKASKDGLRSYCKECNKLRVRKYKKENPGKQREWLYKSRYKNVYDIDEDKYQKMIKEHDNKCAICGNGPEILGKALCVDHDHETGEIRGLLCTSCNSAIGFLKDDPLLILEAYNYLLRY